MGWVAWAMQRYAGRGRRAGVAHMSTLERESEEELLRGPERRFWAARRLRGSSSD